MTRERYLDARSGQPAGERITLDLSRDAYLGRLRRMSAQWNVGDSCISPEMVALIPCAAEMPELGGETMAVWA